MFYTNFLIRFWRFWVTYKSSYLRRFQILNKNIVLIEIDFESLDRLLTDRLFKLFNSDLILVVHKKFKKHLYKDGEVYTKKILITLSNNNIDYFRKYSKKILDLYENYSNPLIILIPSKDPPVNKTRYNDGKVTLLLCNYTNEIDNILSIKLNTINLIKLCYNITKYAVDNKSIETLLIREFNDLDVPVIQENSVDIKLILPHKGNLKYLESCLEYLAKNKANSITYCICFDEEITDTHKELITKYTPRMTFNKLEPSGVGPYVARQLLADQSNNMYLTFQDSDDIPTYDRLSEISKFIMQNPNVDWFGSQSIRLNELTDAIDILRYPIDVSKVLDNNDDYCLLLPTSSIKNNKFKEAGGFSTVRKIASDRQFLYRAHINNLQMSNINKFLYLRRRRRGSLTMSLKTGFGSEARSNLQDKWREDFEKVKKQLIPINKSSLYQEYRKDKIELIEIS